MKPISKAVENAPKSKIRKLFDMAAGRSDVISLGIGQPDFPSPKPLIDGTIEALKKGITVYAPTRGLPELKNEIAKKVKKENGFEVDGQKNIMITNGGSQAITLALAVLLNPDDEVVFSSPNFVSYFYCTGFFYSKSVEVSRNKDYSPDFDQMRKKITPKTKAIIVCSPNNPTGYTYTDSDWKELADIVVENDLYLLSDEPYENFLYDNNKKFSPASMNGLKDRTITLNCISKTFAAPGYRLGYVIANEKLIDMMEVYMQYTIAGVNHPAQFGALKAFQSDIDYFPPILESFNERRTLAYNRLSKMGFDVNKPGGSFYIMPSVKKFGITADEFAMSLMEEKGVAVVPGDIFGSYSGDKIRISYATAKDKLEEALNRIEDFIKKF